MRTFILSNSCQATDKKKWKGNNRRNEQEKKMVGNTREREKNAQD